MKGFTKAITRTPHMLTSKVGMSKKSNDPEFEEHARHFGTLETATDKLLKDTKAFNESCGKLFEAGAGVSNHFSALFQPLSGEYDLIGKNPDAAHTIKNLPNYGNMMEELKAAVQPELELIQSRILQPSLELRDVLKAVRKSITKREHKLTDYDRFNNSLTKLREKKERTLSDEKNLFKLEQDFEVATNEYDYINTALKQDLPRFMNLATRFIDPLFHSFFYMQLNIYYMMLEKFSAFAENNYDTTLGGPQIAEDYESKRSDAWEQIENLNIAKRLISTAKLVQANRALNPGASPLARASSSATASSTSSVGSRSMPPPSRAPTTAGSFKKAPPPPPASFNKPGGFSKVAPAAEPPAPTGAPPPYSAGAGGALASNGSVLGKKAPPPPPLKPKPKAPEPAVQYVTALYDFEAQADGDLAFRTGDKIEVVQRTQSTEDWWTGKLNGKQGVFPGNYVQD